MRHPDRWVTGWMVLPGEPPYAHRPDPDDLARFMCRLVADSTVPLQPTRPAGVRECGRCTLAISRARKKVRKAAARAAREARSSRRTSKVVDLEEVDRLDRARERGVSIRTVSGGLPTLGRGRR